VSAHFRVETAIAAPVERVFDLSLSIDAHVASMAHSREQAVAGVTAGTIRLGEEVTWRATHFGLPFTMTSKIVELDRPTFFVDEQTTGPFRRFRHEHRFQPDGDGTIMTDEIAFAAPFGPIGHAVERMGLTRYLVRLIRTRNEFLKAEAES
jgi:ligand-binding SRPBCC domain-containing protein